MDLQHKLQLVITDTTTIGTEILEDKGTSQQPQEDQRTTDKEQQQSDIPKTCDEHMLW
jgi:hypothetical protein